MSPAAPAVNDAPLVAIRDLRIRFRLDRRATLEAVKGISFDIPAKRTVALVGESGSGKSVTALALMGLLPRENASIGAESRITFDGRDLLALPGAAWRRIRGAEISMIFQEPMSSLNPVFSVGFQLGEVLRAHRGLTRRQAHARAIELLGEVGIQQPARRVDDYPFRMSGGEQQRVMIAMAIACEPKLLIADEPTTALDVTIQKQILDLIAEVQRRHEMSVLFITHDLAVVGEIADQVVVMRDGTVREDGPVAQIFGAPRDPYTQALLRCRPQLDRRPAQLPVIDDFLDPARGAGVEPAERVREPAERAREPAERVRGLRGDEPILLEARGLSKSFVSREGFFGRREVRAVKDVSFRLAKGRTLGLVGESGSGKSTLGWMLARLHEATAGEILLGGENLLTLTPAAAQRARRRVQIVFQNPYASLNPRFTIGRILTEPMRIHGIGDNEAERRERARALLHKVGLPAAALHRHPHEFSGGQRQRIAIARCLALEPEVLICDESVSALDVSVQAQVLNLLQALQDETGMSYLFISHDLAVVKYMADEVMVMCEGEAVEIAPSDEIYRNPGHPYTRKLLAAIPKGWSGTRGGKGPRTAG